MARFLTEYTHGNVHKLLFRIFQKYAKKEDKILDVGSWSGVWWKRLIDNGYKNIYLIDGFLEPDIPFEHFIKSDFTKELPYQDEEFDIITNIEVIEHVENQFLFIKEMLRCIKKDGYLCISTPNINTILWKLLFMFSWNLFGFLKCDGIFENFPGHINPFYLPSILAYFDGKIQIEKIYYSNGRVPFLWREIPFKNRYIGNTVIYMIKKL